MVKRRDRDEGDARGSKKSRTTNTNDCTVFVGNLAFQTSWQNLKDHMRKAGNVDSANILQEKGSGGRSRSKGCAFVTFQSPKEAQRAIKDLDGSTLDGRQITVQADQRTEATARKDPPGRAAPDESSSVFVGNLSYEVTGQGLKDLFQKFGRIEHAEIVTGPNGRSKGYGLIQFVHATDAQEAMKKMDGKDYKGRPLQVKPDKKSGATEEKGTTTQLFVGNLPYETTWKQLKDMFQKKCKGVEKADIMEGPNGRKKGFGMVKFATEKDAEAAISKMRGFKYEGREIEVRFDKKVGESEAKKDDSNTNGTQLYVGNLSFEVTWQELKDFFRKCGKVEDAQVIEGPSGNKKGFGIVRYAQSKDAEKAIRQLDGKELKGRVIQVRWDKRPDYQPPADSKPSAKPDKPKRKKAEEKKEEPYDETVALDSALKASRTTIQHFPIYKQKTGLSRVLPVLIGVLLLAATSAFVPCPTLSCKRVGLLFLQSMEDDELSAKPLSSPVDSQRGPSSAQDDEDILFFDMEAQRQTLARRMGFAEVPLETNEASKIRQAPQYELPKKRQRDFVVNPTDSMLAERQALATRIREHLAAVNGWIADLQITMGEDYVGEPPAQPVEDEVVSSYETENFVEAELVSPLATGQRPVPNLFQIGFELQAEARKTAEQQAVVAALARNVTALRRTLALDGAAEKASSIPSPPTNSTPSLELDVLNETAEQLEAAAKNSRARLSALERTKALLLEMQAQVEAVEQQVQAKTAASGNWTLPT